MLRRRMTAETTNDKMARPLLEWLLRKYPDTPKTRAKQWIAAGRVSVHGQIIRLPHQLLPDPQDALSLLDRHATTLECGATGWQIHPQLTILHLDAAIAVVNKGAGLLSAPAPKCKISALSILHDFLAGTVRVKDHGANGHALSLPPAYRRLHPWLVQRLDQNTSGVFCMALNPTAQQQLIEQLKQHTMRREYVAYVEGRPPQPKGTWKNWLKLSEDGLRQIVISSEEAKATGTQHLVEAITHYEVITEFPQAGGRTVVSKLRFRLETGRKHQIRAQAAFAGVPLIGDSTYNRAYRDNNPVVPRIKFPRQALHAETLILEHPAQPGKQMVWSVPLPKDLQQLEALLRAGRGAGQHKPQGQPHFKGTRHSGKQGPRQNNWRSNADLPCGGRS